MTALEIRRPLVAWTLALAGAGAALIAGSGCANVLGIEETELLAECVDSDFSYQGGSGTAVVGDAPPAGADFKCVGNKVEESELKGITVKIPLAKFEDFTTPIIGLKVRACAAADPTCASPLAETISDDLGVATLDLETATVRDNLGFTGYVEISGPATDGTEYIPYLLYFSKPLLRIEEMDEGLFPTFMVQPAEFPQKFHSVVGADASVIEERGWLVLDARDCGLANAGDIRYSIADACQRMDSKSAEFYFNEGAPSGTVTVTDAALPLGGFLNVLPDVDVTVRAFWLPAAQEGQDLLVAEKTVVIRAGHLTTMRFEANK